MGKELVKACMPQRALKVLEIYLHLLIMSVKICAQVFTIDIDIVHNHMLLQNMTIYIYNSI
jgi:hypothetical protein